MVYARAVIAFIVLAWTVCPCPEQSTFAIVYWHRETHGCFGASPHKAFVRGPAQRVNAKHLPEHFTVEMLY